MPQAQYTVHFDDGTAHTFSAPAGMSDEDLTNRAQQERDVASGDIPTTQSGGFWQSLGDTAKRTGSGIVQGVKSSLNPANIASSALEGGKAAVGALAGDPTAAIGMGRKAVEQGKYLGEHISEPEVGGQVIGGLLTAAAMGRVPPVAGAMRGPIGRGIARVGNAAQQIGDLPAPVTHALSGAVGIGGGGLPGYLGSEIAGAAGPPLVRMAGRGISAAGRALAGAPPTLPKAAVAAEKFEPRNAMRLPPSPPKFVPPASASAPALSGLHDAAAADNIARNSTFGEGGIMPSQMRPTELEPTFADEAPVNATSSANAQVPRGTRPDLESMFDKIQHIPDPEPEGTAGPYRYNLEPTGDMKAQMDFLASGRKQSPALTGLADAASWGRRQ